MRRAEDTDDLESSTDQEMGRGKRRRFVRRPGSSYYTGSDEGEIILPEPPFQMRRPQTEKDNSEGSSQPGEDLTHAAARLTTQPDSREAAQQSLQVVEVRTNPAPGTELFLPEQRGKPASQETSLSSGISQSYRFEDVYSSPSDVESEREHVDLGAVVRSELALATRSILKEISLLKAQNEIIIGLLGQRELNLDEPCAQNFPLFTVRDLEELEDNLKASDAARQQLCNVLSTIGGNTVRNATANIMRYIVHDSLGVEYSLCGQKGKKALNDTSVYRVIVEAVRKNRKTASASDVEIRDGIMAWLKNCRARLNNSEKRTPRSEGGEV